MTAEELMTIANMGKGTDMSSYEHFMMAEKSARRPSGVGIAGLAIGSTALLAAVGAWIFGGVYANSQSKGNQRAIDILATTALAQAEALALLLNGGSGRNGQVNPQPVALYQPAMPCCCNTGCGCNQ